MLERSGDAAFDYDLHGADDTQSTGEAATGEAATGEAATGEAATGERDDGQTVPTNIQWHFFDESRLPVAVQTWQLPPGGREGMHQHPDEEPLEELYLVIEGSARMRVDERTHDLGPGDSVLAPVASEHDLRNTGDTTLKVVVVWGKPAPTDWSGYGTGRAARRARS